MARGGRLEGGLLRADAVRFRRRYREWGRYGVSGFLAVDDQEIEVLCETRLERFAEVVVLPRTALLDASIEIVPTFRRPHVTLAHPEIDALVDGLRSCEHRCLANPHFGGRGTPR